MYHLKKGKLMFTSCTISEMEVNTKGQLLYAHIYNSISVLPVCIMLGFVTAMLGEGFFHIPRMISMGLGIIVFLVSAFFILRFIWSGGLVFTRVPTEAQMAGQREAEQRNKEEQARREADDANEVASNLFFDSLICNVADMHLGEYFDQEELPESYRLVSLVRFVHDVIAHPGNKQLQADFAHFKSLSREPENHLQLLHDLYSRLV